MMYRAHFVVTATASAIQLLIQAVPRVGDEVRMPGNRFYRVNRIVWVYDEPEGGHPRVNIGLEHVE